MSCAHVISLSSLLAIGALLATGAFAAGAIAAPGEPLLEQGRAWTHQVRDGFWYIDQGSRMMPLKWFLRLERSDRAGKFAEGLDRYGFVRDDFALRVKASARIVGAPYIGLAAGQKTSPGKSGSEEWVGLTCAACHSGQLQGPGGERYFIEGAPAMLDFDRFLAEAVDALQDTLRRPEKWARFAAEDREPGLRERFQQVTEKLATRRLINTPTYPAGFGRVDAFGHIFNQVMIHHGEVEPKYRALAGAPASFPVLWDIAQHEYVQWNASAPNLGVGRDALGSLLRNIGEVLGVFGEIGSANIENMKTIEDWVAQLRSPQWPKAFGLDEGLRKRGEQVYARTCRGCHEVVDRANPPVPFPAHRVPIEKVGTDPLVARNIRTTAGPSGVLQGKLVGIRPRAPLAVFREYAYARELTGALAFDEAKPEALRHPFRALWAFVQVAWAGDPDLMVYKARPLNGVWASAPYLHNGAVPSLEEMLKRPSERLARFCVGDGRFDPVAVGFRTYRERLESGAGCPERTSLIDTAWPGSQNVGHEFGTTLTPGEKKELIEYLKSL